MGFEEEYRRARGNTKAISRFYTKVLARWTKEQSPTYFTADYSAKDICWDLGENLSDPSASLSEGEIRSIQDLRKKVNREARKVSYHCFSPIPWSYFIIQKITAFYRNHFNRVEAQATRQKAVTGSIAKAALSSVKPRKQKAMELWYSQNKGLLAAEIDEEHQKNPTEKRMLAKNRVVGRRWKALPVEERTRLEGETGKELKRKMDLWKLRGTWSDTPEHYAR
jgi:hypothetical protein